MLFSTQVALFIVGVGLATIAFNVIHQKCFASKHEPPVVFHWIPFLGSTITYGIDPYKFLFACRDKYGDIFTFILLGRKTTVYLGIAGNEFILNGREKDINAEEIYGPLCNPVFGSGVCYDCPNSKLMEQKKFIKYGLTQEALVDHVQLIENEVLEYINKTAPSFKGASGVVNVPDAMAQITIFTAGRTLQGKEVRKQLTSEFADLFHDLEKGFRPINFMLPWFPLPHNRVRDAAHVKMRNVYLEIIKKRRQTPDQYKTDMLWNLMRCTYKDGHPIPDQEIAHLMITLLMAGQHSSSNASAWILLYLATQPEMAEKLYQEQLTNLPRNPDGTFPGLRYDDLDLLQLHKNVIKETLRIHNSIHSILRQVKNPMPVPGTRFTIPAGHVVLASPGITANSEEHFPDPTTWNPYRWENNEIDQDDESDMVDYGYGRVSKGTRSPYLPFGGGRHRCIGEKFAYVNMLVIVATMVRTFRFANIAGVNGIPKTDYSNLFSGPMQPAVIRWERREQERGTK